MFKHYVPLPNEKASSFFFQVLKEGYDSRDIKNHCFNPLCISASRVISPNMLYPQFHGPFIIRSLTTSLASLPTTLTHFSNTKVYPI